MKYTIRLLTIISIIVSFVFVSCSKNSMNNAKTHHFSLTFEPGDTWQKYSGITNFDTNDVVIVYVWSASYSGENYWVQLPHMYSTNSINIWPEFGEETGDLFINTTWADGTAGSPWSTNTTLDFKAVRIPSSGMILHPNLDYSDYKQVEKAYNLE